MIEQGLFGDPRFKDFFDFVFIDEKWFYLSQKPKKYYLLPEEMNHIALVKTRITSLGSCSCVFVHDQGLRMENVFLWKNRLFSTCHL
jgi:putative heme iron utilization protein